MFLSLQALFGTPSAKAVQPETKRHVGKSKNLPGGTFIARWGNH